MAVNVCMRILLLCGAVAAIMVHVPGTLLLVHYLGFAGAGWAVVVMRTAHLSFTIGQFAPTHSCTCPALADPTVVPPDTVLSCIGCSTGASMLLYS